METEVVIVDLDLKWATRVCYSSKHLVTITLGFIPQKLATNNRVKKLDGLVVLATVKSRSGPDSPLTGREGFCG